ncbi:MAG: hypothetical protein IJK04_13025, partial [Kiritimatiellae bacterium]|nr:hypothetical protein [Kiritimatiellia bacterium]
FQSRNIPREIVLQGWLKCWKMVSFQRACKERVFRASENLTPTANAGGVLQEPQEFSLRHGGPRKAQQLTWVP